MNRLSIILLTCVVLASVASGYFYVNYFRQDNSIRGLDGVAEFVIPEGYYVTDKLSRLAHSDEGQRKALFPIVYDGGSFAAKPEFKRQQGFVGPESCRECHADFYEGFVETAHYKTSSLASPKTVRGLPESEIKITTGNKNLSYEIVREGDDIFQLAKLQHQGTTYENRQRVDVVTGSGNIGQTYLYLEHDRLYELPISWLSTHGWCNSPRLHRWLCKFCASCQNTLYVLPHHTG